MKNLSLFWLDSSCFLNVFYLKYAMRYIYETRVLKGLKNHIRVSGGTTTVNIQAYLDASGNLNGTTQAIVLVQYH